MALVPRISPEYAEPWHLREWVEVLERCATRPVRAVCSVAIRHFKTETTLHGIAWLLIQDPTLQIILFTYDHERAEYLGRRTRQICEPIEGIGPARGFNKMTVWQNASGGGVMVMSAAQSKLGQNCDVLIFDDPLDEHGAYDQKVRDAVDMAIAHYTARCGRPGRHGSVCGIMSRWHPDDPAGRRFERSAVQWEQVTYPAIIDEGLETERAFAPDVMTLQDLKQRRAELREADPAERIWRAQYMNNPNPDA
jgi:hypothetical protein